MNPWLVVGVTLGLIIVSAFFVVIEFALLAVRRHRLEEAAHTSRSARAALKGANELTVMLAGAQLGITARCDSGRFDDCILPLGQTR